MAAQTGRRVVRSRKTITHASRLIRSRSPHLSGRSTRCSREKSNVASSFTSSQRGQRRRRPGRRREKAGPTNGRRRRRRKKRSNGSPPRNRSRRPTSPRSPRWASIRVMAPAPCAHLRASFASSTDARRSTSTSSPPRFAKAAAQAPPTSRLRSEIPTPSRVDRWQGRGSNPGLSKTTLDRATVNRAVHLQVRLVAHLERMRASRPSYGGSL